MKRILFCICLVFSSAVSAEIVKYSSNGVNSWTVTSCTNLVQGDVFDTNALSSMCPSGKSWDSVGKYGTITCIANGAYYADGAVHSTLVCDGETSTGRIIVTSTTCESPYKINSETGICEEAQETCEDLKATDAPSIGTVPNDGLAITASRIYCVTSNMCEAVSSYRASGGSLVRDTYYTGNECVGNADDYADDPYYPNQNEPLPNGCVESGISATPYFCNEDSDGDGTPDEAGNLDPYATCDYNSSGKFGCTGGSFAGVGDSSGSVSNPSIETTEQETVDDLPEVTVPASGDVVEAVVNLNNDINKSISNLNKDLNKSNAQIEDQLKLLNSSNEAIKSQIVQSEQTSINIGNQTIRAIDNNTSAVNGVSNAVSSVKSSVEGLSSDISASGESIVAAIGENGESILTSLSDGFEDMVSGLGDVNTKLDGLINTGQNYTAEGHGFDGDEDFHEYLKLIQEGYEKKKKDLEELLKSPPDILGSGTFNNGQYSGDTFKVRNQNIGFNLFGILGNSVSLIYSVVVFIATVIAVMIVLGSVSGGRKD